MKYTLNEIAKITNAKIIGDGNAVIEHLLIDSRTVSFPEESLFIALVTDKNNGHRFIENAKQTGVRNFLVSETPQNTNDANFLVVENTLRSLQKLTEAHRKRFSCPVVGVTGSNGKTIVKEWIYQLLNEDYIITRSPRSYNSQIGVPLSVWALDAQTELGIFEAGISKKSEMQYLAPIIKPTIGIFTHLGEAHQENFVSQKEKCSEKLQLFKSADILIYEKDDKLLDIAIQQENLKANLFSWGINKGATVQILSVDLTGGETTITYEFKDKKNTINIPFVDKASIKNTMHCLTLLLYLNFSPSDIAEKFRNLKPVAMRLEVIKGQNNCIIINDSYNSDCGSLGIALDFLNSQAAAKTLKKTVILSDIFQTGKEAKDLYPYIANLLLNKKTDRLIAIGKELYENQNLFTLKEQNFFLSTDEFLLSLKENTFANEAILLKGARSFTFEHISERVSSNVHQTTLEVDLNALVHNVDYFRSFLKPTTKMVSMVKAYAYGSGDVEVARTLQHHGVDYLAVAVADEGAMLRSEGIHIPIIVMNPEVNSLNKIIEYHLEPEIYNFSLLDAFQNEVARQGEKNYPIHVKIDTGMHRLGFEPNEAEELVSILKKQKNLLVRSVFSHLVGSDESRFDDFTMTQIDRFQSVKAIFEKSFSHKILFHILNSAGIERFNDYQFDMVRLGIGHYGMSAVDNSRLEEVCTLKTTILSIKNVEPDETVGYSRNGKLSVSSKIAAIPIGYADGLDRKLGNRNGKVLVNGQFAPIVGNVCMDICMIDITGINAKVGDSVIIFGKDYSINEVAKQLGTISYEVLTGISRRVKRVYFKE